MKRQSYKRRQSMPFLRHSAGGAQNSLFIDRPACNKQRSEMCILLGNRSYVAHAFCYLYTFRKHEIQFSSKKIFLFL